MTYGHAKIKVKRQLLTKLHWKQTDWRTETTDCITIPANAVGKYGALCDETAYRYCS